MARDSVWAIALLAGLLVALPSTAQDLGPTVTFRSRGLPAAAGLDVSMRVPARWTAREGRRPSTLVTYLGEGGTILCLLQSAKASSPISQRDIVETLSEAGIRQLIPSRAQIVSIRPARIDGLRATRSVTTTSERAGAKTVKIVHVTYVTVYSPYVITLSCGVRAPDGGPFAPRDLEPHVERFAAIAGTVVIHNQSRRR